MGNDFLKRALVSSDIMVQSSAANKLGHYSSKFTSVVLVRNKIIETNFVGNRH
jgi:hypothetical protein